jgi:putative sterol carrier protein
VLTTRLKPLEAAGVAARRALPRPAGGVVYELTPRGRELEAAVVAIGRWGPKLLDAPRTTFRPEAAGHLSARYELHVGDIVLHAIVDGSHVTVGRGPIEDADLTLAATPALKHLMSGEMTPRQALASGAVRVRGNRRLFERFAKIFRI